MKTGCMKREETHKRVLTWPKLTSLDNTPILLIKEYKNSNHYHIN